MFEETFLGRVWLHGVLLVLAVVVYGVWPRVSERWRIPLVVVLAVGVRVLVWPVGASDDVNRYVWEGGLVMAGENPYLAPADDGRWEGYRDGHWEGMNHREATTIYPPLMQMIFGGTVAVWPEVSAFKVLAGLFDLACLPLLFLLGGRTEEALRRVAGYAVFPVAVISFAGEGHFDSLMVCAWLGAVLCMRREKFGWGWFLLGCAVQIKLVAVVLMPLFLRGGGWRGAWAAVVPLVVPCLFFWEGMGPMAEGILRFGGDSSGNGLVHLGFENWLGGKRAAGVISVVLLGCAASWAFFRVADLCRAGLLVVGTLVVVSPTVTYWYLAWVLPFAVIPGVAGLGWWVLGGTGVLYYGAWWYRSAYGVWWHPYWAQFGLWVPGLLVMLWDAVRGIFNARARGR